jgi:hypothetical protein
LNEHFSPDFEGPFRPSRQLSKSSAREKNQVQKNLDLHFAINISGNSPFGTPEACATKTLPYPQLTVNQWIIVV